VTRETPVLSVAGTGPRLGRAINYRRKAEARQIGAHDVAARLGSHPEIGFS
jgi:hypothetical protein